MATYEQAMEALRRADTEGNVEDAQKLAEIAARLRPQGAGAGRGQLGGPAARPASSMGEYLGVELQRGLTETPAAAVAGVSPYAGPQARFAGSGIPELYQSILEKIPGADLDREGITTKQIQEGMGVDVTTRPATTTQKYLGATVRGMADPLNLTGLGPTRKGVGLFNKCFGRGSCFYWR